MGEVESVQTMRHFTNNPRQITKTQFERLKETMSEFGDLSGIVVNELDGIIIGGNQRSEAAELLNKEPIITERFDPPQEDGTVALGYFDYKGRRFQYRAVRWDADKAIRANLVANVGGGSWDWDALSSFPAEMLGNVGFDHDLLMNYSNDFRALGEFVKAREVEQNQSGELQNPLILEDYAIIIECDSEIKQSELLERFNEEGLRCRALIS